MGVRIVVGRDGRVSCICVNAYKYQTTREQQLGEHRQTPRPPPQQQARPNQNGPCGSCRSRSPRSRPKSCGTCPGRTAPACLGKWREESVSQWPASGQPMSHFTYTSAPHPPTQATDLHHHPHPQRQDQDQSKPNRTGRRASGLSIWMPASARSKYLRARAISNLMSSR